MNEPDYQSHRDDEIDLRDILLALIEGWYWIVGTIVVAMVIALVYLNITTPVYSTDLTFTRASNGLSAINSLTRNADMGDSEYSPDQVKTELAQELSSYENFTRFLEGEKTFSEELASVLGEAQSDVNEPDSAQRRFFTNNMSLNDSATKPDSPSGTVTLKYPQEINGPALLNNYFNWTKNRHKQDLVTQVTRKLENTIARNEGRMQAHLDSYEDEIADSIIRMTEEDRIKLNQLQDELKAEQKAEITAREERIATLTQAEAIAKSLGITKPTTPSEFGRSSETRDIVYAEINSQGELPLYFMGTEALQAERKALEANLNEPAKTYAVRYIQKQIRQLQTNREIEAFKAREQNSPFIAAYNELQMKNTLLRANSISPEDIEVAQIINPAYNPSGPDSPKKALILALSLVLGGMLGVILVFIARLAGSMKEYRKTRA